MKTTENQILEILKEIKIKSGGHSGASVAFLIQKGISTPKEIKDALNRLYRDKKIIIREGINNKLIFLR